MTKMKPKWMNIHILSRILSMQEIPRYLIRRMDLWIKELHSCMKICLISRISSGSMKNDKVALRDSVPSSLLPKESKKPGNKSSLNKNWKRRLVMLSERMKKEKSIVMTKPYCLNLDLNLVTYTLPRKFQIMNTICLCKMISTPVVILNGSSTRSKTQGKTWQSNSMSWTLLNQTLSLITVWKSVFILKNKQSRKISQEDGLEVVNAFRITVME